MPCFLHRLLRDIILNPHAGDVSNNLQQPYNPRGPHVSSRNDRSSDSRSIRALINRQRRELDDHARRHAALNLARQLARHPRFIHARRIAAYLAVNGEISLQAVIDMALAMNKEVYLPVLLPFMAGRLWFARYRHGDILIRNRYGIPEPRCNHRNMISTQALDLVLTPLVAFDEQRNRLGMGGGYYDRSFAFLLRRRHWKKPYMLGVAHDFQRVRRLQPQPWDVPLDGVVTDTNFY